MNYCWQNNVDFLDRSQHLSLNVFVAEHLSCMCYIMLATLISLYVNDLICMSIAQKKKSLDILDDKMKISRYRE